MSGERIEIAVAQKGIVDRLTRPSPLGKLAYFFCALIIVLALTPHGWVTDPIAKVLTSLVWPSLILTTCITAVR